MKDIIISKTKKITADKLQYVYCVKYKNSWAQVWFYNTLKGAYEDLVEVFTRQGDKDTLRDNVEEAIKLLEGVKKEIKQIKL